MIVYDEHSVAGMQLTFRHETTEEEWVITVPPDFEEDDFSHAGGAWRLVSPPGAGGYTEEYLRSLDST